MSLIVVPCYNESLSLPIFYQALSEVMNKLKDADYEIILINDGSTDSTLSTQKELAQKDQRVKYLSFSRNFGKESAIFAGLEYASGDYVIIMDADMQDPPSMIPQMIEEITQEGYDCIATRRTNRKGEPPVRSFFAHLFYKIINKISHTNIVDGARDFRLMNREMVNAILKMGEYNRFSKGIFGWVGFQTKWLEYENVSRVAGETKWSFWKLLLYSFEGIIAFSTAPLALASIFGILLFLIAMIMVLVIVIKTVIWGDPVAGFPTLACLILLIGGIQLFCMGILGEYLAKTYLETKKRPIYIIKETNFGKKG